MLSGQESFLAFEGQAPAALSLYFAQIIKMAAKRKSDIPEYRMMEISVRCQIEIIYEIENGAASALPSKAGKESWANNSLWRRG